MEANTGVQGRQAIISLTPDLAYIDLETACMEENVPIQSGTSSQGESGVGQQGKAAHYSFDTIIGSLYPRNLYY